MLLIEHYELKLKHILLVNVVDVYALIVDSGLGKGFM